MIQGQIEYHGGTWFDGILLESKKRLLGDYKHGKHHYANHRGTYMGAFLNDRRHGQGTLEFSY